MSNLEDHEAEQAEITTAWEERHCAYLPSEPGPNAKRWYVTVTWDDWPEGGSYGNVVTADDSDAAETAIFWEMAQSRVEEGAYPDEAEVLEDLSYHWIVVDCFDLDEFIARHSPSPHKEQPMTQTGLHPAPAEFTEDEIKQDHVLQFFHYSHLPSHLQTISDFS